MQNAFFNVNTFFMNILMELLLNFNIHALTKFHNESIQW